MKTKFILLDRDGTLVKLVHHLVDSDQLELLPNSVNGLIVLRNSGFRFGVITNQSVINRGKITLEKVREINQKMVSLLISSGITIDFIYICPHTPNENCQCRKPKIANGIKAIREFNISIEESYMIGDMLTDVEFGVGLGMKTIQIASEFVKNCQADYLATDILDAANWILGQ
jgi:D-glycero-D-manno-heptose 1,7-bisphosphate phosphatase